MAIGLFEPAAARVVAPELAAVQVGAARVVAAAPQASLAAVRLVPAEMLPAELLLRAAPREQPPAARVSPLLVAELLPQPLAVLIVLPKNSRCNP